MSDRTCSQGHRGCLYIGDAPHGASPPAPLTEEDVRRIVREEMTEMAHEIVRDRAGLRSRLAAGVKQP